MTSADGVSPELDRQQILDATIAELVANEPGSVTMEAVAERAGVSVQDIKQAWASTPELLNAALMAGSENAMSLSDNGSLREDMLQYARSFADLVNSPFGRRIMGAVVAKPNEWDVMGFRETFFETRRHRVEPMLVRAIERGECAPDIDTARLMDLLNAGLSVSLQLYNRPVTDADCEFVVDTLLNGVLRNR